MTAHHPPAFVPRAWDLWDPGRAVRFLEPEGLAAEAPRLPLPCRALSIPLAALPSHAPVSPPGLRGPALRGRRSLILCGTGPELAAAAAHLSPAAARALANYADPARRLRFADGSSWDLDERPRVMGIVNVTPDSFSDGGSFLDAAAAAAHAGRLLEEGADLLDLGAESTRPGAAPVDPREEWARLGPALAAIRRAHPGARLSVDTRRAEVARRALDAGADLVNDVAALGDPGMGEVVAAAGVPVALMHMRGDPATMQLRTGYDDVAGEVAGFLAQRAAAAREAGIADDRILLDPGLGFAKSAEGNVALLAQLRSLLSLGYPLLVGASRKRFIGLLTGVAEPAARVAGSVAAAVAAVLEGAGVVRVHDVAATRQALAVAHALRAPGPPERGASR